MADMDAFLEHHVGHYLQSMRTVIAQHIPNRMYWGPTTLGGWGAPARGSIYRAAGQHLDVVGVGLGGFGAEFNAKLASDESPASTSFLVNPKTLMGCSDPRILSGVSNTLHLPVYADLRHYDDS